MTEISNMPRVMDFAEVTPPAPEQRRGFREMLSVAVVAGTVLVGGYLGANREAPEAREVPVLDGATCDTAGIDATECEFEEKDQEESSTTSSTNPGSSVPTTPPTTPEIPPATGGTVPEQSTSTTEAPVPTAPAPGNAAPGE